MRARHAAQCTLSFSIHLLHLSFLPSYTPYCPIQVDDSLLATCIKAVTILAVDAVNKANAGHPGSAMGLAPLGVLLFAEIMRFNPSNPAWPNRDRFVLSNGHACLLQYILLHLSGYNLQVCCDVLSHREIHINLAGSMPACCSTSCCTCPVTTCR